MEWLSDNTWLAWLGLALVLAAVEAATVDLTFLMLSGGALAASLAAALGVNVPFQIVIGLVVASLLVAVVRPLVKRRFMSDENLHGIGTPSLVGREARVLQTVTEWDGRVKLAGDTWSARTPDGARQCRPGEEVTVVAIEGATAIVTSEPVLSDPTA